MMSSSLMNMEESEQEQTALVGFRYVLYNWISFKIRVNSLSISLRRFIEMAYVDKQGGISNGEIINMRIAFKPTSTISVSSLSLSLLQTRLHVHNKHCYAWLFFFELPNSLACDFYLFLNDILVGAHRAVGYKPNVPSLECMSQSKPTGSTVSLFEKLLFVWMQHIFTLHGISC